MKKWIYVCLFIVSDHGISGEVDVLSLLTHSTLLNTSACGIGYWDLRISLPSYLQCIWLYKGVCKTVKAKMGQAMIGRDIVPQQKPKGDKPGNQ